MNMKYDEMNYKNNFVNFLTNSFFEKNQSYFLLASSATNPKIRAINDVTKYDSLEVNIFFFSQLNIGYSLI